MVMWLDQIILALNNAKEPVRFFFRDDDAGWADSQLFELLDCFSKVEIPVDLAVIPQAIDNQERQLYNHVIDSKGLIGVHQHGFSHSNHQLQGRKCEFGSDRTFNQQQADIYQGRELILEYFADHQIDPIFTPPWNRCNQDTIKALINSGITILSKDNTGEPLKGQIQELPVNIDWFKKRKSVRLSQPELGHSIAQVIACSEAVGIMLHHAIMDQGERQMLNELLELLSSHPKVKCERMKEIGSSVRG